MTLNRVAVLGLGNVGHLAAELLQDASFDVTGFDERPIPQGAFEVKQFNAQDARQLRHELSSVDAVLSCLPYNLNSGVAEAAHEAGIHYFDLTEDVATTKLTMDLAQSSSGVMAPQCGLAPGFVGIVAADLEAGLDSCRSLRLRAGALPQHPTGHLGYSFNWSPVGVVNEYLNDCDIIEDGEHKLVPPLERQETVYVDGTKLEAFTTSGGIGTMCSTYLGRVGNMDYKTLRYPGHVDLMSFFFHELLMKQRRVLSGDILLHAKPPVQDDVVFVHISAEGTANDGQLRREFVKAFYPRNLCGKKRTAISWTTAASAVAVIELVRRGDMPTQGFLRQEAIPFDLFSTTLTGALLARFGQSISGDETVIKESPREGVSSQ